MSHLLRSHSTENCEICNNDADSPLQLFLKEEKRGMGGRLVGKLFASRAWESSLIPQTSIKMPGTVAQFSSQR